MARVKKIICIVSACMLMIISFGVGANNVSAATAGTDYDDYAYYNVKWNENVIQTEGTTSYSSTTDGQWKAIKISESVNKVYNKSGNFINNYVDNYKNTALWYGWVDKDGYWHGHIYANPTVTNSITGEEVAVTKWEVKMINNPVYGLGDMGTWTASGTGSKIDVDSLPEGLPQVKGASYNNLGPDYKNYFGIRLYLADGNSILVYGIKSYSSSTGEVVNTGTAKWTPLWDAYSNGNPKIGSAFDFYLILGEAKDQSEYHFYIDNTLKGADKDATYTIPVKVSINGGAPVTMEFNFKGSGTTTKEVTFKGYSKSDYKISVVEDESELPEGVTIVKGSGTAQASLTTVDKNDKNTGTVINKIDNKKHNNNNKKKNEKKESNGNGAKTGDDTSMIIYIILGIISVGGIATVAVAKRKLH